MKKKQYIIITILVLIILTYLKYFLEDDKSNLTESEAISILKKDYPEYQNYPNDNLPPQSIRTDEDIDGWYISFVQEGSGRPIIKAKCFFVDNNGNIRVIGEFEPKIGDIDGDFSIRTCALGS